MLNRRRQPGPTGKVVVLAAAARLGGQAVVEQQYQGFAETETTAVNQTYALATEGEYEVPLLSSAAIGDTVWIGWTTFALARTAAGAAAPTIGGNATVKAFAKISAIPGSGQFHQGTNPSGPQTPAAGKMWVILLPQPA